MTAAMESSLHDSRHQHQHHKECRRVSDGEIVALYAAALDESERRRRSAAYDDTRYSVAGARGPDEHAPRGSGGATAWDEFGGGGGGGGGETGEGKGGERRANSERGGAGLGVRQLEPSSSDQLGIDAFLDTALEAELLPTGFGSDVGGGAVEAGTMSSSDGATPLLGAAEDL
jgi:hypothetical protein